MVPPPSWARHPLLLKRKGGLKLGVQGGQRPRPPTDGKWLLSWEGPGNWGLAGQVLTFTNRASRLALSPCGMAQLSCSLARLIPVVQCSSSSWLWQHCSWTILRMEGWAGPRAKALGGGGPAGRCTGLGAAAPCRWDFCHLWVPPLPQPSPAHPDTERHTGLAYRRCSISVSLERMNARWCPGWSQETQIPFHLSEL